MALIAGVGRGFLPAVERRRGVVPAHASAQPAGEDHHFVDFWS